MLENGVPGVVDVDLPAAVAAYNRSASMGNATAQFTLGVLHAHGLFGVRYDEPTALLNYYFAALGGNAAAQVALGYAVCAG